MKACINNIDICKIPSENSCIYKDECLYCFDSTDSEFGLFICMKTFIGVCKKHLDLFYRKSKNELYLNIRIEKRVKLSDCESFENESDYKILLKEAITRSKVDIHEFSSLWLMPDYEELILQCDLPEHISLSVKRILSADSVAKAFERGSKNDTWDGNYLIESKFAWSLEQLNNGVKVAPSGWKCSFCDLTTNLWMNLTDGTILCGRKFFDGSGGNNHAIEYYQQTQYPLAVKLGTITPAGADVYSYAEDEMVTDCLLAKHLKHFGIDIMKMEKTDKNTEELEMESINSIRERIAIMESGTNQEVLSGPGLSGINNIGNSCYINSVLQVLLSIPTFQQLYTDNYLDIIEHSSVINDVSDFRVQLAKLGHYLRAGDYSKTVLEIPGPDSILIPSTARISPHLLRSIIGKGHEDFKTTQQQDTFEYLMHVLNFVKVDMKKNTQNGVRNPLDSVAFKIEERIFCQSNQTVKYQSRDELVLSLGIPLDQAINTDYLATDESSEPTQNTDNEVFRPIVKLESCLDQFMHEEVILDYSVNGQSSIVLKSSKLKTFPEFLWIHMKRFTVDDNWTPKKLDVEIDIPDRIDLSHMSSKGLQVNETEMRDDITEKKIELDQSILNELSMMGFPDNACKKAVYLTGNSSLEDAANWLMMHIGDADFEELPKVLSAKKTVKMKPEECDIDMMTHMGFSRQQGIRALQETNGNLERAADWAFSHQEELLTMEVEMDCDNSGCVAGVSSESADSMAVGPTTYSLSGMISHMGNNAHVGHYVCHIKREDGSWVLYNDDKVYTSHSPPKKFAYLYLFKREV